MGPAPHAAYGLSVASSKRRPSKQKRYRQNRQIREARQARSAHAGEATAASRSEDAGDDRPTTGGRGRSGADDAAGTAGTAGARGARGTRKSPFTVPGQRAVLMAFMFTIVSAVMLFVTPFPFTEEVPPEDPRVEEEFGEDVPEPNDDGLVEVTVEERPADRLGLAATVGFALAPVAITGAALAFSKRPQRSTAWTVAMVALAGYVFLGGGLAIYALPAMIALAVGGFQSRRVENKERLAQMKAERAERERRGGGGEVIDVDAVEAGSGHDTETGERD